MFTTANFMGFRSRLTDREWASFLLNNKCARIDAVLEMTPLENQPKPGELITILPGCRVTIKELLEASRNDPGWTECDWTKAILDEEDLVQIVIKKLGAKHGDAKAKIISKF